MTKRVLSTHLIISTIRSIGKYQVLGDSTIYQPSLHRE